VAVMGVLDMNDRDRDLYYDRLSGALSYLDISGHTSTNGKFLIFPSKLSCPIELKTMSY